MIMRRIGKYISRISFIGISRIYSKSSAETFLKIKESKKSEILQLSFRKNNNRNSSLCFFLCFALTGIFGHIFPYQSSDFQVYQNATKSGVQPNLPNLVTKLILGNGNSHQFSLQEVKKRRYIIFHDKFYRFFNLVIIFNRGQQVI